MLKKSELLVQMICVCVCVCVIMVKCDLGDAFHSYIPQKQFEVLLTGFVNPVASQ